MSEWEIFRTEKCVKITERRRVECTDWFSRFMVFLGFVSFGYRIETRERYEFRGDL